MPKYFDAHSHLNFPQYNSDRDAVIGRMEKENVCTICVGTDVKTSAESIALAERHDGIFATVGIHPSDVEQDTDTSEIENLLGSKKIVGIGECGLDYFRIGNDELRIKNSQKNLFEKQIELALKHKLPLMIHARPSLGTMDAYADVVSVMSNVKYQISSPGNVHFFVGTVDIAKQFLDLGFTLSFDGPITFTREYDEVVRFTPLDMMLAETDAPFAAPAPYRGKRNEPLYVKEVVAAIARIKDVDIEIARTASVTNASRVFQVDLPSSS